MITKAEIDRWAREQGLPGQGLLDFLSRTDELLIANLKVLCELTGLLKAASGAPGPSGQLPSISVFAPRLGIRIESLIAPYGARSTETIYPTALVKCFGANRVAVIVNNQLNQQVQFDIIGNASESYSNAFIISSDLCPTLESRVYILKFEEWMPYVGVQVTPSAAPTMGSIEARAIIQEAS